VNDKTTALRAAFPHTIPVLTGFLFLGIAYGILMQSKGFGVGWTFLMSLFVFAGSAQYAAVTALTSVFNPLGALLLTLVVNARHLFYGISVLDTYKDAGKYKLYMIFGLCDETFSLVCSAQPPAGVDRSLFMFFITLLDHFYWVAGSVLGGLLGAVLSFDLKGLDFVLTALFVVIFLGQWKTQKNHWPAIIGVLCAAVCLLILGPGGFLIPALLLIVAVLLVFRKKLAGALEVM
jgi:4-azaleucine resistance transporter AzlC